MWNDLTMSERADVIKMAVKAGLRDMKSIRDFYDNSLKYADGGPKNINREYKSANSWSTANVGKTLAPILEPISRYIMNEGEQYAFPEETQKGIDASQSTAQDTYLLPRNVQKAVFKSRGYESKPQDYGLVKKAVDNRNIPVYQKAPDDISRDKVVPMLNIMAKDTTTEVENWFGRPNAKLEDPGSFPTALYLSTDGKKVYQKGWDLNDYFDSSEKWFGKADVNKRGAAAFVDLIGSPTVVTTGISEVGSLTDLYEDYPKLVEDMLATKGLVPLFDVNAEEEPLYTRDGELIDVTHKSEYVPSLPEVTITGKKKNKKEDGGDITYVDTVRMDSNGNITDDKGNAILHYNT